MLFECPPCFLKKNKQAIYVRQNFYFLHILYIKLNPIKPFSFKAASSTREHWTKILTTLLAIISIHLEGMDDTPSLNMYHHLKPWLQGNLVHIDMDFNFSEVPHNDFEFRLGLMLDTFETGDLQE
jgi:hypothetical protein